MYDKCFISGAMQLSAYDAEGRRKYLTSKENRVFLATANALPSMEAAFCLTLYYTGCRISEALNLTVRDVDREACVLRIRSLKKRKKKLIRRVPIPPKLARSLCAGGGKPDDRIWKFCRTTGWRIIKRVMAETGITGVQATPKGLRHSFGVRGALQQIPITLLRDWMGHADIMTTAIYLDVKDEEEREFIKRTWKDG